MTISTDEIANQMMDVIPGAMRVIRSKFRERRAADLSVAHFRTLAFINTRDGVSLSDVAEHIGLTLPSMSKMIDGLVSRKLVNRAAHNTDRRRVCLSLTDLGKQELQASYAHTHEFLVERVTGLSEAELNTLSQALGLMRALFFPKAPGAETQG